MAKSFIDLLLDDIFDAEWKGRYGEKMTEWELNLVRLFGRKGYVLRNIYVPVSYTHLDVYKRQRWDYCFNFKKIFRPFGNLRMGLGQ